MSALMLSGVIVMAVGAAVMLLSVPFFMRKKNLIKNCTAETTGNVIGYVYRGSSGAHSVAPKVEFVVDGEKYKAFRHYKAVASVHKKTVDPNDFMGADNSFWISENDVFHVKTKGGFANYKALGEATWPIGTTLPVVYNPNKPKQAFVEKVVSVSNIAGIVIMCSGLLFVALGALFFFISL